MSNELIVMTFPHRGDAKTIIKAMKTMRKSPILSLDSNVLVTKNKEGDFTYRHKESDVAQETRDVQILLSLAKLIFDPSQDCSVKILIEKGLDDWFIKDIAGVMQDEASALFFLLDKDRGFDNQEMLNTLALFKGTIHQTSLLSDVVDYLAKDHSAKLDEGKHNENRTIAENV